MSRLLTSRLPTILLPLLLASPNALLGQAFAPTASIRPGTRVRITQIDQKPRVAVVVARSGDTLLVRWQELTSTVAVPLAEISGLDVSIGQHRNVAKRAMVGTLGVGAFGALMGASTYTPCTSTGAFSCMLAPESQGQAAAIGGVVGGVLGLVVGTLVGLPREDDWRKVPLDARRVSLAVTPRGSATGIGMSLRF